MAIDHSINCLDHKNQCLNYDIKSASNCLSDTSKSLSVLNINIRSLVKNYDNFLIFLDRMGHDFDFIILTESWLTENNRNNYPISGYKCHTTVRTDSIGGGVAIYCKESYTCKVLISEANCSIETLFISAFHGSFIFPLVIGGIYRPPGNRYVDGFYNKLENILNSPAVINKKIIIAGDLNINLLNTNDIKTKNLINSMNSFNMNPLITLPTRYSLNNDKNRLRLTLIDHIFSNINLPTKNGVIEYTMSDHYPNFSLFQYFFKSSPQYTYSTFRNFSVTNKSKFIENIRNADFNVQPNDSLGLSEITSEFINKIENIFNKCFPICKKRISVKRLNSPWLSNALIKSIDQCHKLNKQCRLGYLDKQTFNQYRNKLNSLVRSSKCKYYKGKFDNFKNDMRKTWKNINNLLQNKMKARKIHMHLNGTQYNNDSDISNAFSRYFSEISGELINSVQPTNVGFESFLGPSLLNSFYVEPTTSHEVKDIINSLKSKGAPISEIPAKIYKSISEEISPCLSGLINLSFKIGEFPDCLKTARVVPIFKDGDPSNITNYRPISTLPFISKIYEKIMFKRLNSFFSKYSILNSSQYGFREKMRTEDGLIDFCSYLYDSIDLDKYCMCTYVDFKKAFDTVSHDVLLAKLEHFGVRGRALQWFHTYLTQRKMFVDFNGAYSSQKIINVGVPQGSVLGPFLFLLYINDIVNTSRILKYVLYADDTAILYSNSDFYKLLNIFNHELEIFNTWTRANKIVLNYDKTKFMIVTRKQYCKNSASLKINDIPIGQVKFYKYLGVTIDDRLSFNEHANCLSSKLSSVLGVLRSLSFLPRYVLQLIYYSLGHSALMYGIVVWGSASSSIVNPIFILQKKIIRVITCNSWYAHTSPIFKELKVLKFHDLYELQMLSLMYRILFLNHMPYAKERILSNNVNTSHMTRNNNLRLPIFEKTFTQRSFYYCGPKLWNIFLKVQIPLRNVIGFRKSLKDHFLNKY